MTSGIRRRVERSASRPALWHPPGWIGALIYVAQIAAIGFSAGLLAERSTRRLMPLVMLLNMTLLFPDQAPS
ncbi:MAG: hypothetical protein AAFN30_15610, partial [Actinomycetota bacterium]